MTSTFISLAAWIAGTSLAAISGAVTAQAAQQFYGALDKARWAPPPWLFGPAWAVLYVLMAVAAWRIWCLPESAARTQALRQFVVQLVLNAAWSPVFFGMQSLGGGLAIILLMAIAIVVTIQRFHPLDRTAAWLMAPYLAWVSFASILNVALLALNGKF